MIRVMLSLDLIDVVDERNDFYGALADDGWKKAKNVDTVWLKKFTSYTTLDEESSQKLRNEIANSVIKPAAEFKIKQIFYVAQLGNDSVISRVVEKRDGKILAYPHDLF